MPDPPGSESSSQELLALAQAGDEPARERLFKRYLGPLQRWARGRLPVWARDGCDTDDLVQDTLLSTLRNLGGFEHRHPGALPAYLRQAVHNRVRDLVRSRPKPAEPAHELQIPDDAPDPLRELIGRDELERYERALEQLPPEIRALVIARVELAFSYKQIALEFDKPSPEAARMAVVRAIEKLATIMGRRG